ncbi:MAG: hypothetical protein K0R55_1625, partial [Sporomusa sp.]|nr:hypothetical protein [Sporomusa sp.]
METMDKDNGCDNTFECEVARYMNWFIRFLHVLFCLALVITV